MDIQTQIPNKRDLCLLSIALLGIILGIVYAEHRAETARLEAEHEAVMRLPDTLQVVTLSGATTYFTIQGEEMGYQYDLLKLYAEERRLPYRLTVLPNLDSIHARLERGEAHLSITPEAITRSGQERWRYAGPLSEHALVLVQKRQRHEHDSAYVHNVTELIGKPLYVLSGSSHEQRLQNLGEQLGAKLDVRLLPGDTINSEDLIAYVATDSIKYTIVDAELARLAQKYYPNTDISLEVGFPQRISWLTTSRYEGLAEDLDRWGKSLPQQVGAKHIYKKYFESFRVPIQELEIPKQSKSRLHIPIPRGAISPYDDLFKAQTSALPWSWQLLAAIAYQESRFNASVVGWSGARGLMGVMPSTGRSYGASKEALLNPKESIRVALRCLADTERAFRSISSLEERLLFTLAGYNAGVGHVQDAQRLASKYGYNPNQWSDHVERFVLLKGEAKYYTDAVCKHGYLRGRETVRYTQEVSARYHAYRQAQHK